MSIVFACPACGNRLRVGDELARKRVACPDCRALLTAPAGEETAPVDAVPVAELVAGAAPARPPTGVSGANLPDEERFASEWLADDRTGAGPRPPQSSTDAGAGTSPGAVSPGNVWSFDDHTDGQTKPPPEGQAALVRRRDGATGTTVRWAAFGAGCGLVSLGLWVELAGIVCLFLATEATLLGSITQTKSLTVLAWAGPSVLLPFFLLLIGGTALVGVGRFRMLSFPPETGAGGVFGGALALGGLRLVALFAGVTFAAMAVVDWRHNQLTGAVRYTLFAGGGYAVALLAGVVADATVIPGMAVVGGALPSGRLRRRAGLLAFVFQLSAAAWVGLVVLGYIVVTTGNPFGVTGPPRPDPAGQPGGDPPVALVAGAGVVLLILLVEVAYTYLHSSLYAAGRQAAADGGDAR